MDNLEMDNGYEATNDDTTSSDDTGHYTDYQETNYSVPTVDPEGTEPEETEEIDYDSLHQMMTEYMREKFELPEKFKDVGSLINSYKHLESRLGSLKGAPEVYEIDGKVVDTFEPDLLNDIVSIGKEMGIDNDGMNKLLAKAAETQTKINDAKWEMELHKLGPNAREEVARDIQYLNANFAPEMAKTLQSMVQTADQYRALQSLIMDHRMGSRAAPAANTSANAPITQETIDKMLFAKDSFGNLRMETDSAYQQKVMSMMNQLNGR